MSEHATYVGIEPRTIKAGNAAIARGVRVNCAADGTCTVADASTRGQFVTLTVLEAGKHGVGAAMQAGGKVPMVAAVAVTPGAQAFAAAGGLVSNTGSVLVGAWLTTSDANTLGQVELFSPA